MKIRLRGQSLRLRLGQSEVRALAAGRAIEETTVFGPVSRFVCVVRGDGVADAIAVSADAGRVVVRVPARDIETWAGTDAVGLSAEVDVGGAAGTVAPLRVLIEKDFVCLDNDSGESQADAFPNPSVTC